MQPDITISETLLSYLSEGKYDGIVVDVAECSSCGGAIAEVYARAAKNKELSRYIEAGARHYETNGMTIVLVHRLLRIKEHVELGLKSIFFVKDVTVDGIYL